MEKHVHRFLPVKPLREQPSGHCQSLTQNACNTKLIWNRTSATALHLMAQSPGGASHSFFRKAFQPTGSISAQRSRMTTAVRKFRATQHFITLGSSFAALPALKENFLCRPCMTKTRSCRSTLLQQCKLFKLS